MLLAGLCALGLWMVAAGLIASHLRAWRQASDADLAPAELEFASRQYYRRMRASGLVALLGLMILVGEALSGPQKPPLPAIVYWLSVLLLVVALSVMAGADFLATYQHFGKLRRDHLERQAAFHAEMQSRLSQHQNGHSA